MKRLVLLVISLAGFGAAAVSGGLGQAPNTASDTVDWDITSGDPAAVCTPEAEDNFVIDLDQGAHDDEVPTSDEATPVYTPVADILVGENDVSCDYYLTALEVTSEGTGVDPAPECDLGGGAGAAQLDWDFALDPADAPNGDLYTFTAPGLPVTGDSTSPPASLQDTLVDLTLFIEEDGDCTVVSVTGGEVTGTFVEQPAAP
jgi:hypothetical protein